MDVCLPCHHLFEVPMKIGIILILPFLLFDSRRQCPPRPQAPRGQVLSLARDGRRRESASSGVGDYRGEEDEEAKGASTLLFAIPAAVFPLR